jgi:small subunit ribosomal protein S3Ae
MAEKAIPARPSARKVKDKWKAKGWYSILAPEMFNRQVVGETPAEDLPRLQGRIAEVTLQDLTGDFAKMHIKLQFRVTDVRGNEAHTQFVGHDLTPDYIRRLTRRKRSRTDQVIDVTTKDGWRLRVKPLAITDRRIQAAKQGLLRNLMVGVVKDIGAKQSIGDFVRDMISGDLAKAIANACKPIQPIQRVEIRKSEVVSIGEVVPFATPGEAPAELPPPPSAEAVPPPPAPESEPAEEELPPPPPPPP